MRPIKLLISIVIPTYNGEPWIEKGLTRIFEQKTECEIEVIVIDSGSTDNTLSIVRMFNVQLIEIDSVDFNHGDTRNFGANISSGEFIVMTVQDAIPESEFWLEHMYRHFSDGSVSGVCGSQVIPHDKDKNPIQWTKLASTPKSIKIKFEDVSNYRSISSLDKRALCGWDNVTAMYRKSALLKTPFRRIMFGEDGVWANDILMKGEVLVYEPNARVSHYHHQPFSYRFKRMFTIMYHDNKFFECIIKPRPWWFTIMSFVYHLSKSESLTVLEKVHWITYNFNLIVSEWLAYYIFISCKAISSAGVVKIHSYICGSSPVARDSKRK